MLPALLLALIVPAIACATPPEDGRRENPAREPAANEERTAGQRTVGQRTAGEKAVAGGSEVGRMSVREMVGQMFVVSVGGTEPDYYIEKMVRKRNIGGVILFGHNMETEAQVASLTSSLQGLSMQTEPAIPLLVAVDQEGGDVASAPWVAPEPAAAEIGARGNAAQARAVSGRIGARLLGAGVNTNFAPVVDTGFGAAIGTRSYGEDPGLVSEMGVASVKGFEEAGIASSAKHFPNHGPATTDSHERLPVVNHDAETLRSHDLPPFRAAVEAGVPMVMVGHLLYPSVDARRPASLSPRWISLLREELGFDGVVVTDDLAMAGASGGGPPAGAAVEAVKAGADVLVISNPPQEQADAYDAVVAAVESGKIPEEQLRSSVGRILEVKKKYGFAPGARIR